MTNTCKSAHKTQNRFKELGEAVEEHKDSDIIDPNSSLTGDLKSEPSNNDFFRYIPDQNYYTVL